MSDDRLGTLAFWAGRTDALTRDQLVGALHRAHVLVESCNFQDISQHHRDAMVFRTLLQNLGLELEFQPGKKAIRTGQQLARIHGLKPKAVAA